MNYFHIMVKLGRSSKPNKALYYAFKIDIFSLVWPSFGGRNAFYTWFHGYPLLPTHVEIQLSFKMLKLLRYVFIRVKGKMMPIEVGGGKVVGLQRDKVGVAGRFGRMGQGSQPIDIPTWLIYHKWQKVIQNSNLTVIKLNHHYLCHCSCPKWGKTRSWTILSGKKSPPAFN